MSKSKKIEQNPVEPEGSRRENIAALLGVISYARDEARRSHSDLVAFCLDIAFVMVKNECEAGPASIEDLRRSLPRLLPPWVIPQEADSMERFVGAAGQLRGLS